MCFVSFYCSYISSLLQRLSFIAIKQLDNINREADPRTIYFISNNPFCPKNL